MATRRETSQQKNSLKQALRKACEAGVLRAGEMAPSLRQIADEYSVSRKLASQVLQELVGEGLFYTIPRVGTFVGRRVTSTSEYYLYLNDEVPAQSRRSFINEQMRAGFEERIAILGGAVLALQPSTLVEWCEQKIVPPVTGVFSLSLDVDEWRERFAHLPLNTSRDVTQIPVVRYGTVLGDNESHDLVSFDDYQGGFQVTEYLQQAGHERIAFLGLHAATSNKSSLLSWSLERERGWRDAMKKAKHDTSELAFHPRQEPDAMDWEQEMEVASELGRQLLAFPGITAVVAANDATAMGLMQVLRQSGIIPSAWPAIVGFDGIADTRDQLITSAQLSWHQIGSCAAELLWQRYHGQLTGQPQHRKVPMRIITRMTSQSHWPQNAQEVLMAS